MFQIKTDEAQEKRFSCAKENTQLCRGEIHLYTMRDAGSG
jgi:hypothetical protein